VSYGPISPLGADRIRLSSKASRSDKTVVASIGVITVLVAIIGIGTLSAGAYLAVFFILLCLFGAAGFSMALRTGAWLERGRLVVRSAFSSRSCDLAASTVRLTADPATGLPVLVTQDPAGQPVSLLLCEPGAEALLSPAKLHALADAIVADGRQDPAAWEVASNLRTMADSPPVIPPRQ
jgi:hypothetical protein